VHGDPVAERPVSTFGEQVGCRTPSEADPHLEAVGAGLCRECLAGVEQAVEQAGATGTGPHGRELHVARSRDRLGPGPDMTEGERGDSSAFPDDDHIAPSRLGQALDLAREIEAVA